MKQITGDQFHAFSKKKTHSHFSFLRVSELHLEECLIRAAKVFLVYAVQLVASKLPEKIAPCENEASSVLVLVHTCTYT